MKNVIIFALTEVCLLVGVSILTVQSLPIGLQKFLSGHNYQVVLGPKEFVSKYEQSSKGSFSRVQDESSNSSDSEYVIYGKLYVLKKKTSAKVRNQNEETNIIIPSYPIKQNDLQYPIHNKKSEGLDSESIVFPKETRRRTSEYKRFGPDSLSDDTNSYKSTDMAMGRFENGKSPPIPALPRNTDSGKLQKEITEKEPDTIFGKSDLDQEEGASTATDVFKMQLRKQEVALGAISIQELEKWADVYKTTTVSPQIENTNSTTNDTDLSFQSLFIVPSLKNPQGGCPEGKRKNHAGVCVTPYIHKGNSDDDSSSTKAKPVISSLRPIQSTLTSLMESLRSVELQALQALLGSTAVNTTTESSTTDDIQIGSRYNFPNSDTSNSPDVSSTSTTAKPNYVYSLLTPLNHQRNSDLTLEPSTERSLLEILQEYGKINFDFSKVQQLQRRFTSAHKHV